jgi:hypothetical protein
VSILETAQKLIHGARQKSYGHPLDDFSRTAGMLTYLLRDLLRPGVELKPEHVGAIMVVVKLSREMNSHGLDNLVDGAGYFGTMELVHQERQRRAAKLRPEPGDQDGAGEKVDPGRIAGGTAKEPEGPASVCCRELDGKEGQGESRRGRDYKAAVLGGYLDGTARPLGLGIHPPHADCGCYSCWRYRER